MTELERWLSIAPQAPEADVLRLLLDTGLQISEATEGSLLVFDPATDDLVFVLTAGGDPSLLGQRVPLDKGITGLAAATREVQVGAPTHRIDQTAEKQVGPSSVIAAPMLVSDELIGVITAVTFEADRRFTERHGALFGRLATVAALVIHQRQLIAAATRGIDPNLASALAAIARRPGATPGLITVLAGIEKLLEAR